MRRVLPPQAVSGTDGDEMLGRPDAAYGGSIPIARRQSLSPEDKAVFRKWSRAVWLFYGVLAVSLGLTAILAEPSKPDSRVAHGGAAPITISNSRFHFDPSERAPSTLP